MLKLSRILMCFLVTLFITSCVDDDNVTNSGNNFSMLKMLSLQLPGNLLPIDIDSIDALQRISISDVSQDKPYPYSNAQYQVVAATYFRERPFEASNVFCNGARLPELDNGFTKSFFHKWEDGTGPYYQTICFQFVRDGETVYDTIQADGGCGKIRFLDTNGNEPPQLNITAPSSNYNLVWENTGPDDILLVISLTYLPDPKRGKRPTKYHTMMVPNTGSFNITRSFLEANLGADFADSETNYLSVILGKIRCKVKNYGPNNEKTLLTMYTADTGAAIWVD